MAQALDGLKKYDEAEEFYVRALDVDPNQAVIHILYGRHLDAVGRKMDAEAQYEMAHDYTDAQTSRAHTFELDNP
jgi:Tfp pilus assembly protein PilF